MRANHLRNVDLNLLVSLQALLQERSVSGAAEMLYMTQPGMSRNLARLRDAFDDPLLVRSGTRMTLTPRAKEIAPQLELLLASVTVLLHPRQPVAAKITRRFKIAAVDSAIESVLCYAISEISRTAPGVSFEFINPGDQTYTQLREGRVDIAVDVYRDTPPGFRLEQLYENRYVALLRRNHPLLKKGLTKNDFEQLQHIKIVGSGGGAVEIDEELRRLNIRRQIVATTSSFSAAAALAAQTDWLSVLPINPAKRSTTRVAVEILELPFTVAPIPLTMLWHAQSHDDFVHAWLRREIRESVKKVAYRETKSVSQRDGSD